MAIRPVYKTEVDGFLSCIDPTCSRTATDSEVDHLEEWVRDMGSTNRDNLFPLCERGNLRKNLSRIASERRPSGKVSITTPTGYTVTTDAPTFMSEAPPF